MIEFDHLTFDLSPRINIYHTLLFAFHFIEIVIKYSIKLLDVIYILYIQ